MDQIVEFLTNHPELTLAFVALLGGIVWTSWQIAGSSRVSPSQVTNLINNEDAVVVDVQSDSEYERGHIVNAMHIPTDQLLNQEKKLKKHKDRPIVTVCRTGQRSPAAAKRLKQMGFGKVYDLAGGLAAWESANLPLTRD